MVSTFVAWLIFGLTADSFFAIQVTFVVFFLYGITLATPRRSESYPKEAFSPDLTHS
jgi:hypothetical protein